ncbi:MULTISPECIES: M50 family metallopeptidase [unclassified Actinobaculum]|uniref:M50 family metallopeptidase n=1 Tax=unclassified Actinobaculum TaxID=2609299 RepID=UPI000D529B96|nr:MULTISPECIES: M50 family metallopeptidase [unclassified Actinobaculum]AWE41739.1 hypothetical protein DDD63_02010 [Actinobaculum sp. 313]
MDQIWYDIAGRLQDSVHAGAAPSLIAAGIGVGVALTAVVVPQIWKVFRVVVTLVHELGHAAVGVITGRKFAGFTVEPDMSGATATRGPSRGPGLVLTTLAGYPMPALIGALLFWLASTGRARPTLLGIALVIALVLFRARSVYTLAILLFVLATDIALWWWGEPEAAGGVVLGLGLFLLVGAWRQFCNVLFHGDNSQDPGALAARTRVPAFVWNLIIGLLLVLATDWAVHSFLWAYT